MRMGGREIGWGMHRLHPPAPRAREFGGAAGHSCQLCVAKGERQTNPSVPEVIKSRLISYLCCQWFSVLPIARLHANLPSVRGAKVSRVDSQISNFCSKRKLK